MQQQTINGAVLVGIFAILAIFAINHAEAAKALFKPVDVAQINYTKIDVLDRTRTKQTSVLVHKVTDTDTGVVCYIAASDEIGFSGQAISCVK